MNIASVTVLDDERLIREGEAAVLRFGKSRDEILPMARGLLAARRRYSANQDFGRWIEASTYAKLGHQDRAALIKIGEHEDFIAKFLRTTHLISPRIIWDAVEDMLPIYHHGNTAAPAPLAGQGDAQASTETLASDSAPSSTAESEGSQKPRASHGVLGSGQSLVKDPTKLELVKLLGMPADDVMEFLDAYPRNRQRVLKSTLSELAKGKGKNYKKPLALRLFQRGLEILRSGRAPELSNTAELDVRVFFPDFPEGFARHRPLPSSIENFERHLLANDRAAKLIALNTPMSDVFNELTHLLETGQPIPPKPPMQFPVDSKIKHEVKYCGEVIWPSDFLKDISYEDLNAGWHLADHWLKTMEVATPQKPNEVLVHVNHLREDIRAAATLEGVTRVMSACISAYAKRNNRQEKADFTGGIPPGLAR